MWQQEPTLGTQAAVFKTTAHLEGEMAKESSTIKQVQVKKKSSLKLSEPPQPITSLEAIQESRFNLVSSEEIPSAKERWISGLCVICKRKRMNHQGELTL
ncbi:uncharacterized protein LOC144582320 isoform X2 [Callithrix jacchus]